MIEPRPDLRNDKGIYCEETKHNDLQRMKLYLLQEEHARERVERYKQLGAREWIIKSRKKHLMEKVEQVNSFARLVMEKHNFDIRKLATKQLQEEGKL